MNNIGVDGFLVLLLLCLIGTIVIELLFALAFGVRKSNLWVVVLAQIATNPLVMLVSNLVYYVTSYDSNCYLASMAIMEIIAILAEGILYKEFFVPDVNKRKINPYLLSLLLNLLSLIIGVIGIFNIGATLIMLGY